MTLINKTPDTVTEISSSRPVELSDESHLDVRVPRYTSYPTADRFSESFGAGDYIHHLESLTPGVDNPLSLYVHIPYCESLCYYCACNKSITKNHDKSIRYISMVLSEVDLLVQHLHGDRYVTQLHLGGGTPTFLSADELLHLMSALRSSFRLAPDAELSIEIDPRTVDREKLNALAEAGFNRMSLGIQDFDPDVQRAVNRTQTVEQTQFILECARSLGFQSTNFDLIYGLPLQSTDRFSKTLDSVIELRPDRIALYNYAHLPTRFPAQRLIRDIDLPSSVEKQEIFEFATARLENEGYENIGMDHFALPDDELAIAHHNGSLHRNFQGYSTQSETDLVALGASAISRVGASYSQNQHGIKEYYQCIQSGVLATKRGVELSSDDLLRRDMIMAIMCQNHIDRSCVSDNYKIQFDEYFATELTALAGLEKKGYVALKKNLILVTDLGHRRALRVIASVFDRYLGTESQPGRYSKN